MKAEKIKDSLKYAEVVKLQVKHQKSKLESPERAERFDTKIV